jgi:hypothetical protein
MVPHARQRYARANDGTIYIVNGIDQPQAWDGLAGSTRNMGLETPGNAPTLAAGAAGVLTGDYYYYVAWKNSITGEYSGLSPLSAVFSPTADKITVTRNNSASSDTQIDKWSIFRNTNGQTTTFYWVADVDDGTTTYDDNTSDEELSGNEVAEDRTRPDFKKPFIENFNGRIFLYGSRTESTGTVEATNASATVTGTGTYFRQSHVGQKIRFGTEAVTYTILSVTDTDTLTLTTNYAGSTGSGKAFRIFPTRRSDLAWSSAESNEGFAIEDSVSIYPNDGDIPTGMKVIGTVLALFKRTKSYRFTFDGDPNPITGNGQVTRALSGRGLANNECCVVISDSAFCLDSVGVYQFDGATQEVPIDQGIRRYFHPDDGIASADRISRSYIDTWHAVQDPRTDTVWFFVTAGSETKPKTALVFDRERATWSIHKFQQAITCSCVEIDSTGLLTAFVGDENGCLWSLAGIRQSEGVQSGTQSGTTTSATSSTLTDSGASFKTSDNGLQGVPVTIVSGTGAGQVRIIQSNTGTQLTVSSNWTTTPDTTSEYLVGFIESKWRYKWMRFDQQHSAMVTKLALYYDPTSTERNFQFRVFKDYDSETPIADWMPSGQDYDGVQIENDDDGWVTVHTLDGSGRAELCCGQPIDTSIAVEFRQLDAAKPVSTVGIDVIGQIEWTRRWQRNP